MVFPISSHRAASVLLAASATLAPLSAQASLFGKKAPAEDFTVARPLPVPVASPATGSIFQAQDGYAALYEGWRARKVGDPLTIVLVERTAASGAANLGVAGQDGRGRVRQGMLEASNVNVVEELVDMIETQRAYEVNSKMISATDDMLKYVNQNI